jgi:hypothetical protein
MCASPLRAVIGDGSGAGGLNAYIWALIFGRLFLGAYFWALIFGRLFLGAYFWALC